MEEEREDLFFVLPQYFCRITCFRAAVGEEGRLAGPPTGNEQSTKPLYEDEAHS